MPPRQTPLVAVREKEPEAKPKRPSEYASKLAGDALKHPPPREMDTLSPDSPPSDPPSQSPPPAQHPALASNPQPEPLSDPAQSSATQATNPAAPPTPLQNTPVQSSFLTPPSSEAGSPTPSDTPQSSKDDYHHNSEVEFARLLDYYGIEWQYEPRQFPLQWRDGRPVEMFTPDFYLPEFDLYIELTTMRQALVRRKNRKLRLLRALYPEINIKLLYRRDYQRLLERFGIRPDTPTIGSDGAVYTASADDGRRTMDDSSIVTSDPNDRAETEE